MNGARGTLVAAPPGAPAVPQANGFPTHKASGIPRKASGIPRKANGIPREASGIPREAFCLPREAKGLVHPSPGQGTRPTASFILAQGTALIFIHIFWKADGGSKPPGCDCGDMARVGEHTRPRVSSLAPSPKTFGCDRERWTQKVSGGGAGNSTRGRLRSPPLARRFRLTALASRFVYKNQASMPEALGLHQKSSILNRISSSSTDS